jgi:hypothetical protein
MAGLPPRNLAPVDVNAARRARASVAIWARSCIQASRRSSVRRVGLLQLDSLKAGLRETRLHAVIIVPFPLHTADRRAGCDIVVA